MPSHLVTETIFDPQIQECPYAYYSRMHTLDPVHYDEQADTYLVTTHELITQAAADFEVFSSAFDLRREAGGPDSASSDELFRTKGYLVEDVLTQVDPPRHTAFRNMVKPLFIGPVANSMESFIERHVDELLDGFIEKESVEFFSEFATPLPLDMISDQLGVPRKDIGKFKVWTDAIIETLGIMLSEERKQECTQRIIEFQHYFVAIMEQKRANPSDDIISFIASARLDHEDRELTVEERLALIQQLLVAGNETTRNHLAKIMVLLIQNPEQQETLRNRPDLIKNFVEESLRIESPVQGIFRKTTRDVTLGGTCIPKDAKVLLMYGAGNRDNTMFADAAKLDINRVNAKRHLAFGSGPHACIGSMLARKELQVSIRQILKRMKDIRFASADQKLSHKPNLILRALDGELNLRFTKTETNRQSEVCADGHNQKP
ncbi:MAG: cytochrome P450 [Gammaproteobacteria bacterium]